MKYLRRSCHQMTEDVIYKFEQRVSERLGCEFKLGPEARAALYDAVFGAIDARRKDDERRTEDSGPAGTPSGGDGSAGSAG